MPKITVSKRRWTERRHVHRALVVHRHKEIFENLVTGHCEIKVDLALYEMLKFAIFLVSLVL